MKNLTIAQIEQARDLYMGYCKVCQDWTRDQTEPDATNYDCPVCGHTEVFGSEEIIFEL